MRLRDCGDTPQSGYDDTKALIDTWHGTGRSGYVITPRFAITSSPAQMEMVQALASEYDECHIQTHLSENHDEIAYTAELYPKARDYLDIYHSYGLLSAKTLFGGIPFTLNLARLTFWLLQELTQYSAPPLIYFLVVGLFDDAGFAGERDYQWYCD